MPTPPSRRATAVTVCGAVAVVLAGCSSSNSSGGALTSSTSSASSSPSPSGSSFGTLAAQALVSAAQVEAIAGSGFTPYQSATVATNADPVVCLELLHIADGTRTGPPSTVSSATESFANGSTGSSVTNTVHVFATAADAQQTLHRLRSEVPTCASFSVAVGTAILKGSIVATPPVGAPTGSLGLRVVITSPTQKADVTSAVAPAGRSLVVGMAGTPDGKDEAGYAGAVATQSAALATARIG